MAHASTAPVTGDPLSFSSVVTRALVTYRDRFAHAAGTALVIFVPLGVFGALVERLLDRVDDSVPGPLLVLFLVIGGVETLTSMLGSAFYAGLMDKLVGAHQRGHHQMSMGEVLRTLPYGRLLAADLLLTIGTGVTTLLVIVPGLVFFTYFCLVGPLINIERHAVFKAFRRSAQLVRGHFWLVLFAVTLPTAIEIGIHEEVHDLMHGQHPLLVGFVVNGLTMATVGAVVSLIEVTLTYELSALRPLKSPLPAE